MNREGGFLRMHLHGKDDLKYGGEEPGRGDIIRLLPAK